MKMKKTLALLLALCLLSALVSCGKKQEPVPAATEEPAQAEPASDPVVAWSRVGYYQDTENNVLYVELSDEEDYPGWYVGCMLGEDAYGWYIQQDGDTLRGNIIPEFEEGEFVVTVRTEGEDGLMLETPDGKTYHFTQVELPEASIFITVNTEGLGNIDIVEGEETPEFDQDHPYQSSSVNLDEPKVHTLAAWPEAGSVFVKWTKNGEDFSTDPIVTVLLDESADYVAVFEEDPDWQSPVLPYAGEYQCDRVHAVVEDFGSGDAWITITWGDSAWSHAQWDIMGHLDTEDMTIRYSDVQKYHVTYDENGDFIGEEPEGEPGSGWLRFNDDGTITWHDDQSAYETDVVFEKFSAESGDSEG